MWSRDWRGSPIRAEKHTNGHVLIPKRHGLPEHANLEAFDGTQVRRGRKAVRTSTDYYYVVRCHRLSAFNRTVIPVYLAKTSRLYPPRTRTVESSFIAKHARLGNTAIFWIILL